MTIKTKDPIIVEIKEKPGFINNLEDEIKTLAGDKCMLLLSYPSVYVHKWNDNKVTNKKLFDVYIGESNDIIQRTREHLANSKDINKWQNHLTEESENPSMFIIGHPHFNKSLTLDVENKLIDYVFGMKTVNKVHNARGNPQNVYYSSNELQLIFDKIWDDLHSNNKQLFISKEEIRDSAIFKASPFHKLNRQQLDAKNKIIAKLSEALKDNKTDQLVFVNGAAGTGKTVLMSSTFYDVVDRQKELFEKKINCALIVNHDEQKVVYDEIVRKLDLKSSNKKPLVYKPTNFINEHKNKRPIDIAFIDEGHLLLTQKGRAYGGDNHLEDIMKCSKVTVFVYDENQALTAEEMWEKEKLQQKIDTSISQGNYITLTEQLRMVANKDTIDFIDGITLRQMIGQYKKDPHYRIKVFDNPSKLAKAIKQKAGKEKTKLSRLIATYDWEYNREEAPTKGKYWEVKIGRFHMPWNRELGRESKSTDKTTAWAERAETINEIGSTFTIQGFDLNYAGVIIGPSVYYKDGKIQFNPKKTKNRKATYKKRTTKGQIDCSEELLRHELRVLLTRGVNGLYIYACDQELNNALKKAITSSKGD